MLPEHTIFSWKHTTWEVKRLKLCVENLPGSSLNGGGVQDINTNAYVLALALEGHSEGILKKIFLFSSIVTNPYSHANIGRKIW